MEEELHNLNQQPVHQKSWSCHEFMTKFMEEDPSYFEAKNVYTA